jgi:hypothetical protein
MQPRTVPALLIALCAATAAADAPPPQVPTLYLALDAPSLRGQAAPLAKAVKAALPGVAKGTMVVVVGSDASSPLAPTKRDEIADAVTRRSAGATSLANVLYKASNDWQASRSLRHHVVVLTGAAPAPSDIQDALARMASEGFTVSFVCLGKVPAKHKAELQRRGAGHVVAVNGKTLGAALRGELGWTKLTKAQEGALQTAAKEHRATALLKILGAKGAPSGVAGVIGGGLGVGAGGGLAIGSTGYANPRLRRAESLVGPKLALTFRQVSGGVDLAEVRRYLLAQAKPLLGCLESKLTLSGRDEATVEFAVGGKVSGAVPAATACVQAWGGKLKWRSLRGTMLVGVASSAQ